MRYKIKTSSILISLCWCFSLLACTSDDGSKELMNKESSFEECINLQEAFRKTCTGTFWNAECVDTDRSIKECFHSMNNDDCKSLPSLEATTCTSLKISYNDDLSFCEKIEDKFSKNYCLNLLSLHQAERESCLKNKDQIGRQKCLTQINDLTWDKGIFSDLYIPRCKELLDISAIDHCLEEIAIINTDHRYCRSSRNKENALQCIMRIGEIFSCLNGDEAEKNSCLLRFAIENKNSDVCLKILEQEKRDSCLLNIVSIKSDPYICDQLTNTALRTKCLQRF